MADEAQHRVPKAPIVVSGQEILQTFSSGKNSLLIGILLLCSFSISDLLAWQKNIRFERLSREQGLSHVFVHAITQDDQGFMWFGTADGLNKYDGHQVTVYKNYPNDPSSISAGTINELFVDHEGVLWAGGPALHRYNRETDNFTHFTHDPENPGSISESDVLSIFEDHEGTLWIGTWTQGLNRFDRATESFTRFQHDPDDPYSMPPGPIRSIYEGKDGVLWVGIYTGGTSSNLSRFNRETEKFHPVLSCREGQTTCAQPLTEPDRPPRALVAGMLEDESGNLWVGGYGLIRYDRGSNSYKRYFNDPENDNYPHINNLTGDLVEDRNGLLWFGETYFGLHSFDPETEKFAQYLHDPADPHSIGSSDLMTIFEDRDGLIWIATYFAGVSKFDPQVLAFGHYKHDPDDLSSLGGNRVDAIAEDRDGYLWVAAGGLNKIDRNSGVIALYRHVPDNPGSLHNNDIRTLFFDREGNLWAGLVDGLDRFDPDTEMFTHFSIMPKGKENNDSSVQSIIEDDEGNIWLGTSRTISRLDPETDDVVHFPAKSDTSDGPRGTHFELLFSRGGHIWISSWAEGVTKLDPKTESFTHIDHDPENTESLSSGRISAMFQDESGAMWFGFHSGVDRLNPLSGKVSHFTVSDGVAAGRVLQIIPDKNGELWLGTDGTGLFHLNPQNGATRQFITRDGLQDDFIRAGISNRNGEIILGGNNGLNIFHPNHVPEKQENPAVVFTDFLLMNEPVSISKPGHKTLLSQNINTKPDITLTHRDYLFSVEFAALSYIDGKATRYAYMLEEFDQEWIETDADKRVATYTNVPAGNYVLRVKASDINGIWSENIAALNLKILPPPWKTWWAYTLYLSAFLSLLFGYIRWRTVSLKRQAVELESTVEQRTRQITEHEQVIQKQADSLQELLELKEKLYANISHEFRTPLTLILGPVRRMLGRHTQALPREQLEVVQRNSERLLRLVDQLLSLSRTSEQKTSTASAQALLSHVEAITEPFRSLAEEKGLTLSLGETSDLWVSCTPGSLEKILMNLLSNAIKYTPEGGTVTVGIHRDGEDFAVISVTDTGIGIPPDQHEAVFERFHRVGDAGENVPGAGIGLALVKELTESYGGRVDLSSSPGQGTTINVRLPRTAPAGRASVDDETVQASAAARREVHALTKPGSVLFEDEKEKPDSRHSVLIVEDNPDMQNYLHELLEESYECLVAGNGRDGLEVALEQVPDLVVSDVMMPEMDGYELTQTLKEDQRTSHIPVIMLTARSDQESRLKALRERADDYLIKPFDDEELLLRISNQLAARDIIKARFSGRIYLDEPISTELNERERNFLERFEALLKQSHADPNLDLGIMASRMAVSTRQLQRKLKALTGHSPAEYLRAYRLKKAAKLLRKGGQITQVAMDVGFSSQAYFGTCFKAQFGLSPRQFQQE